MLERFGFTQYESKVYENLLASEEPLDATLIVKHSGVPKAKVYEVISRLIEKGIIMDAVSEKKKLYSALPLELVIEKLTAEFQESIEQLKASRPKRLIADDRVWSLKVEASIKAMCSQMLQGAKGSIRLSVWKEDFEAYLPILLERQRSGVNVEALVVGKVEADLAQLHILSPNEEHRMLERYRLFIIDDEEILFAGVENGFWQAMKTKSKPFVKFFSEFYYHDVTLTRITGKYEEILMKDEEIRQLLMQLRY